MHHLLGYAKRDNLNTVMGKANTDLEGSDHHIEDEVVDARRMVAICSEIHREIDYIMLTRFVCYLIG